MGTIIDGPDVTKVDTKIEGLTRTFFLKRVKELSLDQEKTSNGACTSSNETREVDGGSTSSKR